MTVEPTGATTSQSVGRLPSWIVLGAGTVASLVLCGALAARMVVVGSAAGHWQYQYARVATPSLAGAWMLYTTASVVVVLTGWWLAARSRKWPIVLMWVALATLLQWPLRTSAPQRLEALFISDHANSFYSVSTHHDTTTLLRSFNSIRHGAPLHVQSNMPGKLILVELLQLVSTRTDVLPWLLIGLSNLGALLMYGFVRETFDDERTALLAAALYLFVPARTYFFPLMNTMTPVAALAFAWLLVRWLRSGKTTDAVLIGIALYGLVFFEPLPLVLGLLFLALIARAFASGTMTWERSTLHIAVGICAFIATAETISYLSGFDLVRTFRSIGRHAVEFNRATNRPYQVWIVANLWEFAVGVGLTQVVLFVGATLLALRQPPSMRERLSHPLVMVCTGLSAVLVTVDLLGINRGEVARLWIFLACLFQIPAAAVVASLHSRRAIALLVAMTALPAAIGVSMINFVVP